MISISEIRSTGLPMCKGCIQSYSHLENRAALALAPLIETVPTRHLIPINFKTHPGHLPPSGNWRGKFGLHAYTLCGFRTWSVNMKSLILLGPISWLKLAIETETEIPVSVLSKLVGKEEEFTLFEFLTSFKLISLEELIQFIGWDALHQLGEMISILTL